MKIYMSSLAADNYSGIGQVMQAQRSGLGYDFVENPEQADITVVHVEDDKLEHIDILHLHGLHWTADTQFKQRAWHKKVNAKVLSSIYKANCITVPSHWVGEMLRRDLHIDPIVLPHGIYINNFKRAKQPKGYALWGKATNDGVCDPSPIEFLARNDVECISTFGKKLKNLEVIGKVDYAIMQDYLQNALVYVATVPETFGIQTLEAMAYGVPIIGYDWGATPDVIAGAGILVEPGNEEALLDAYHDVINNREYYSAKAVEVAQQYDWEYTLQRYRVVYEEYIAGNLPKHTTNLRVDAAEVHSYLFPEVTFVIDNAGASVADMEMTVDSLIAQDNKNWNATITVPALVGGIYDHYLFAERYAKRIVTIKAGHALADTTCVDEYIAAKPGEYEYMGCCGTSKASLKFVKGNKVIIQCVGAEGSTTVVNGRTYHCSKIGDTLLAEVADAQQLPAALWKVIKDR